MTKKHLIAIDLDGTLLTDEKTISERTKTTIQTAKDLGHEVVIATGRPFRASIQYYKELELATPIVNFNGAYVHHPINKGWGSYHTPLDLNTAHTIIDAAENFKVKNILAEVIDDVYLHRHDDTIREIFSMGNPQIKTGNLLELLRDDPTSVLIHPDDDTVDTIREHLSDAHAEVIDHRKWGAPWNVIEIVKSGLNKAVGLKKVSDYYQIPKERIIAFGDEDNDLEMIDYAGHGVAMGNAIDELKSVSKHVTKTNNEDGIALYLEDLLGIKTKV